MQPVPSSRRDQMACRCTRYAARPDASAAGRVAYAASVRDSSEGLVWEWGKGRFNDCSLYVLYMDTQ